MNPVEQFKKERRAALDAYHQDSGFTERSNDWLQESMKKRYVYNFDWMGRPIIQYPQDMYAVQELIWSVKPDLVIETGIAHGGSLILSASMLALLDMSEAIENGQTIDPAKSARKVIGIDIDIREHNRAAIEAHPMASRIQMFEGSAIDEGLVAQVKEAAQGYKKVLVFLDSMHTHDHVLAELNAYAPLVSEGSYCVVFDTFVENMPQNFFDDRPWDVGNNPMTAVHEYLKTNDNFEIDKDFATKLQVTVAPNGFLKRVRA